MDNVKIHNPYDNHRQNNPVYSNLMYTERTNCKENNYLGGNGKLSIYPVC